MPTPVLRALRAYRDTTYGYSLAVLDEWYQAELDVAGGHGVVFSPSADDQSTALSIEARDLGWSVSADQLPALRDALLAEWTAMAGSAFERFEVYDHGFVLGIEARQTYEDDGARRKRWVRQLYNGSRAVRLTARAASEAEFARFYPAFAPAMTTFLFGDIWPRP
jgi:hypothetical protein